MNNKFYFTPGPSELYFTTDDHIKNALREKIPSISHRGKKFEEIYKSAVDNLRTLLNLPANFHIFFTGSATEIWERIIQNCVDEYCTHLVNGSFSQRFYETALELGKNAEKIEAEEGECVEVKDLEISADSELIALTQNETSTGAAQPVEDIYKFKTKYPEQIIAVDLVSSLPYIDLDYTQIDTAFFSVQKGFGLPAGLGVWLVNENCIAKSGNLLKKGKNIGTFHSLTSLLSKESKSQTPETPNVLAIYLLAKVCEDMIEKGINQIRQETNYKAAVLYNAIENSPVLQPFVKDEKYRSKTVIVAESEISSGKIIKDLEKEGIVIGSGYGKYKENHLRIANFPTHSKEQTEKIADFLSELK
ncbi:alanine--glyoxylate aminotransferase family protein [soil metagenome]